MKFIDFYVSKTQTPLVSNLGPFFLEPELKNAELVQKFTINAEAIEFYEKFSGPKSWQDSCCNANQDCRLLPQIADTMGATHPITKPILWKGSKKIASTFLSS